MILDPNYSVGVGFFAFRAIVTVALFEPERIEAEGGGVLESTHYLRTYGITAESYSAASEIVEDLAGRSPDERADESDGWLDGIEFALIDPATEDEEGVYRAPIEERGVHFVGGKIFYSEDENEN